VISTEQVTALRALLTKNFDEHHQVIAQIKQTGGLTGYYELVTAAFFEAVDRRFGAQYTLPDIVKYVAEVRTRLRDPDRGIDPNVAERLIRKALGEGTTRGIDKDTLLRTESVLLAMLVMDEQFDDATLDAFLAEARALADRLKRSRE
jgi:hypothetical protein